MKKAKQFNHKIFEFAYKLLLCLSVVFFLPSKTKDKQRQKKHTK